MQIDILKKGSVCEYRNEEKSNIAKKMFHPDFLKVFCSSLI